MAHDPNELAAGFPAEFAGFIGEVRGIEFVPIEFEVADDLTSRRAEIPGKVVATWSRAMTDQVEGFRWEWDGRSSKHIPFDRSGP